MKKDLIMNQYKIKCWTNFGEQDCLSLEEIQDFIKNLDSQGRVGYKMQLWWENSFCGRCGDFIELIVATGDKLPTCMEILGKATSPRNKQEKCKDCEWVKGEMNRFVYYDPTSPCSRDVRMVYEKDVVVNKTLHQIYPTSTGAIPQKLKDLLNEKHSDEPERKFRVLKDTNWFDVNVICSAELGYCPIYQKLYPLQKSIEIRDLVYDSGDGSKVQQNRIEVRIPDMEEITCARMYNMCRNCKVKQGR